MSDSVTPTSETKNTPNFNRRYAILGTIGLLLAFFMSFLIIYSTGIISIINPEATENRFQAKIDNSISNILEGTIFDRNMNPLTYSETLGKSAEIIYPNELSYIIGFRTSSGKDLGNQYVLSGLRKKYADELYSLEKNDKDGIGANIELTIDLGLQRLASNELAGHTGSINVINADTGEILCAASRGDPVITFDANNYSANFYTYSQIPDFEYNRSVLESHAPGSTMKILTLIGILENDIEQEYLVENPYNTPNGKPISNSTNTHTGKTIGLQTAMNDSVNTYFATRALMIGANKYTEIAKRFLIGEDIYLDFADLTFNNFDIKGADPTFELASTAYGQGKTQISPLHLTAIMAGIINEDRDMMKPYLISKITNDGKTLLEGEPETLSKNVIKKNSIAKDVREILHNTAVDAYGFSDGNTGNNAEYGYVIAKSGTAETSTKGSNHAYLLVGYTYHKTNYAICIDWANVPNSVFGIDIVSSAKKIINYINVSYSES